MYNIIKTYEEAQKFCQRDYFSLNCVSKLEGYCISTNVIKKTFTDEILCEGEEAVKLIWKYRKEINKKIKMMNLMCVMRMEKRKLNNGVKW